MRRITSYNVCYTKLLRIRNEKAKLLESVRILTPDEVRRDAVRGQYGQGHRPDGQPVVGYRHEPDVDPNSPTETFAAVKLDIV